MVTLLGLAALGISILTFRLFERLARSRATLSLT
jgi:hypothetical protein